MPFTYSLNPQFDRSFSKLGIGVGNGIIMPLVLLIWFFMGGVGYVRDVNHAPGRGAGSYHSPIQEDDSPREAERPRDPYQMTEGNFIADVGDPTSMVGAEGLQKQVENSFRLNRCYPTCTGSTFGDNQMEQSFYNSLNQRPLGPGEVRGFQEFSNGPTFPGYMDFNRSQ